MKRQGTYLNIVVTAVALLLAGLLWTQVADRGPVVRSSYAAIDDGNGVPDSGAQLERIIRELHEIRVTLEATKELMEDGMVQVQVTNLD